MRPSASRRLPVSERLSAAMPYTSLEWVGLPQKPRADRSKVIDQRVWNSFKSVLHELYFERYLPMQDIADYMRENYNFRATLRQYRGQIHKKWNWKRPATRTKRAETGTITGVTETNQQALRIITNTDSLFNKTRPAPAIRDLRTHAQVAEREPVLHEELSQSLRHGQLRDEFLDSDASEVCSLLTASSSLYSRSFPRSSPATPVSFEVSPHPLIRPQLHLKTPSRNAFRPDTPELHDLKESDFEDLFGIIAPLTPSPETPYRSERSRKLLHRKSSVIGSLLTLPSTQWSPRIEEEFIPPHCDTTPRISHGSQSFLLDESEGEEEESDIPGIPDVRQESDSPMVESPPQPKNLPAEQVSEYTLFPHRHESGEFALNSCCWPQITETCLTHLALQPTTHVEPLSLISDQRTFTRISLPATIPKDSAILDNIQNIVFNIDSDLFNSDDVVKLIRIADFLSATRFFDESFVWSQVAWRVLNRHRDSTLTATPVYSTKVPAWLAIFTNMAKSCTGPEHLRLMASAMQEIPILKSFSTDMLHPSISLLYTFLGEALQRLSASNTATDAAVGCWTLLQYSQLHIPVHIMRRGVKSVITALDVCKEQVSDQTMQQLERLNAPLVLGSESEAIASSLERCVHNILAWCRRVLEHNDFARMIEGIDEYFWTSFSNLLDVARFERLAVFTYLCQSVWSQERLDANTSWIMHVDVVNALQTMTTYTGLTHEAALAAILGIAMPILESSKSPERCTMASRFSHSIGKLYNETVIAASGFDKVGRTLKIENLMNRYTWAGNSKSSLKEIDDPEYKRRVGIFVRDYASRGLELPSSRALQPIVGDLREGSFFIQDTLLSSTRSSQLDTDAQSMLSLKESITKNGKVSRASNSSWRYKSCDCEMYTTGLFGLHRTTKHCPCARYGSNTSLSVDRLSDIFHTRMSLDSNSGKRYSTASSQML